MVKRVALILIVVAAALGLIGSVLGWVILSSWVPTSGKARLIQTLEHQAPITASIGAMRYELLRGFILEDVLITHRDSDEVWLSTPMIRLRVGWLQLLGGRVAFRARAPIEAPCQTTATVTGRYHLRKQALALEIQTTEIPLQGMTAALTRFVPQNIAGGSLRLHVHFRRQSDRPPTISGTVTASRLAWTTSTLQMRGDVTLNGSASPAAIPGAPWALEAKIALRDGTLEGVQRIGTLTQLEGKARLSANRLEIEELIGTALSSRWNLEGTLEPLRAPSIEVLLTSSADLAPLSRALSPLGDAWSATGTSDLRVVCRGPVHGRVALDCLAQADLRPVTVSGPKLPSPVMLTAGHLGYDHVMRQLSIEGLRATAMGQLLVVDGQVSLLQPPRLSLALNGTLPLEAATGWLPATAPVKDLSGLAQLDLQVNGPATALQPDGRIELRQVHATAFGKTIDELDAPIMLRPDRIQIQQASLHLDGQPVTLTATVEQQEIPRIIVTVGLPQGELSARTRLTPDDIVIDEGRLSLERSRIQVAGAIARTAGRPSRCTLRGTVELEELTALPFLPLPALEAWQLQGRTDVEAQFDGQWADWRGATIEARIRADRLRVRELRLEQVFGTLEQRNRLMRIRLPSAFLADGKLWGELNIEHRPQTTEYLLQADLLGLQLAKLQQLVPAWRAREVSGNASARALVSGTWLDRSTWRGEGWLNASGQRLGDLPLLNKVFQGLFGVLADRLGLEVLRRAQLTQGSVTWRLTRLRIYTDDLRLAGLAGTEPVALYAKGSVGLDQSLDFVIEPELSEGMVLQSPTTSAVASTVLRAAGQLERLRRLIGRHRVTGTLKKPEYRFEFSPQEIINQLLAPSPGDFLHEFLQDLR